MSAFETELTAIARRGGALISAAVSVVTEIEAMFVIVWAMHWGAVSEQRKVFELYCLGI